MFSNSEQELEEVAKLMLKLDSPRRVYLGLQTGDYTALELSQKFGIPIGSVHTNLAKLRKMGLIKVKKSEIPEEGSRRWTYTICVKKIQITFDNGQAKVEVQN